MKLNAIHNTYEKSMKNSLFEEKNCTVLSINLFEKTYAKRVGFNQS